MREEAAQDVLARLRADGHRVTAARRAVVAALASLPGHPGVEAVHAAVVAETGEVHLATVYRTLDTLEQLGVVTHVHLGHGSPVYRLVTGAEPTPHLHARCGRCGALVDLPPDLLDPVAEVLSRRLGFELDAQHVALAGTCARCRPTEGEPDREVSGLRVSR